MTKVLACDLDGTLFYPKRPIGMINKKNLKFCRKLIKDGHKLVLVTGRSPFYTRLVDEKIGQELDVIGMNGAYIYINGELFEEHFLSFDLDAFYDEMVHKYNIKGVMLMSNKYPLLITGPRFNFFKRLFYRIYYLVQGVYSEKYIMDDKVFKSEMQSKRVYKLMFFFGIGKKGLNAAKEANKYLREKYKDVLEASWSGYFVEITPHGSSKGEALLKYLNATGYTKDQLYVIGDSGNDISMFNTFYDHSFCMSHSSKNVKKYAKTIVKRVSDLEAYL